MPFGHRGIENISEARAREGGMTYRTTIGFLRSRVNIWVKPAEREEVLQTPIMKEVLSVFPEAQIQAIKHVQDKGNDQ